MKIWRHINLGFWSDHDMPTDKDYWQEEINCDIKSIIKWAKNHHKEYNHKFFTKQKIIISPDIDRKSSTIRFHGFWDVFFINTVSFGFLNTHLNDLSAFPMPENQKYATGVRVFVKKYLGRSMTHFRCGEWATILYTYSQKFGYDDIDRYCIKFEDGNIHAWYYENNLSLTEECEEELKEETLEQIEINKNLYRSFEEDIREEFKKIKEEMLSANR